MHCEKRSGRPDQRIDRKLAIAFFESPSVSALVVSVSHCGQGPPLQNLTRARTYLHFL